MFALSSIFNALTPNLQYAYKYLIYLSYNMYYITSTNEMPYRRSNPEIAKILFSKILCAEMLYCVICAIVTVFSAMCCELP